MLDIVQHARPAERMNLTVLDVAYMRRTAPSRIRNQLHILSFLRILEKPATILAAESFHPLCNRSI
jgi:hypothetical protein